MADINMSNRPYRDVHRSGPNTWIMPLLMGLLVLGVIFYALSGPPRVNQPIEPRGRFGNVEPGLPSDNTPAKADTSGQTVNP